MCPPYCIVFWPCSSPFVAYQSSFASTFGARSATSWLLVIFILQFSISLPEPVHWLTTSYCKTNGVNLFSLTLFGHGWTKGNFVIIFLNYFYETSFNLKIENLFSEFVLEITRKNYSGISFDLFFRSYSVFWTQIVFNLCNVCKSSLSFFYSEAWLVLSVAMSFLIVL